MKKPKPAASLDRLAKLIEEAACADGIPLPTRIDALKALTAHRVGMSKATGKKHEDETDGSDFANVKARIRSAGKRETLQ